MPNAADCKSALQDARLGKALRWMRGKLRAKFSLSPRAIFAYWHAHYQPRSCHRSVLDSVTFYLLA